MATKKESKPVITKQEYIVTDWDKKIKAPPNVITIKEALKVSGQRELQPGSFICECNDGYYQVYNEKGELLHYRVGEKIIKQIMEQEQS